ncbi:AAA family ATPase [Anianabacter salinae]|uniref:tetratricopeptide repeat protein n=1 Tax=Anianabacter salinae TaxID=2851023 RepID=UPI00225E3644|nr:tetratricopeptide repeat protein [Anianabacter salinae]MBV0911719.1 tetratricopeptide repeat protein [Anianabacter salinae]
MSDRQQLAEHGVGFCVAGLGLLGMTAAAPLTSLAVLVAWGMDRLNRCPAKRKRAAVDRAIKEIERQGVSERGIRAALQLLKENRGRVAIEPRHLKDAEIRGNFPDALYDIVFAKVTVPQDDGVPGIIRGVLSAAYEELRLEEDFHKVFVQESVVELERSLQDGFADLRADIAELREAIENVGGASRDVLELLAARFGIADAHDRSDADLRQLLTDKATEYRALKREVDAIDDGLKRLSNLKAAAQDAIARVDLEEVEEILSRVQEVELEEAAKTAELRAENALLRGRVEQAYLLYAAAADSFAAVDPLEPARRRLAYNDPLYRHGIRYGGPGLARAAEIARSAATDELCRLDGKLWGKLQNNLANALSDQGTRTGGAEGAALLAEAVAAYRDALTVHTRADHPVDWATTQNNLALALQNQGTRTGGAEGAALLAEAVAAYREALTVRTRADHPVQWAMTQNNLGIALQNQGTRTGGAEGAALLAEAVAAYRDALTVRTRADHPVRWAMTQNNLAIALQNQGTRTGGPEGAALLEEAVEAYRDALTVRTRADHPVDWAMTRENMAIAEKAIAEHDSTTDPRPRLEAALAHVEAALEVFDPDHTPYNHDKASDLRDAIRAALEA